MTGYAGRQVPNGLPTVLGVNTGRHLFGLSAMARGTENASVDSDFLNSMTAVTDDTVGAGTCAT